MFSSLLLLNIKLGWFEVLFVLLTVNVLVLFGLNETSHWLDHCVIDSRSSFSASAASVGWFTVMYNVVSSAKRRMSDLTISTISFMCTRKSKGPRAQPCFLFFYCGNVIWIFMCIPIAVACLTTVFSCWQGRGKASGALYIVWSSCNCCCGSVDDFLYYYSILWCFRMNNWSWFWWFEMWAYYRCQIWLGIENWLWYGNWFDYCIPCWEAYSQ